MNSATKPYKNIWIPSTITRISSSICVNFFPLTNILNYFSTFFSAFNGGMFITLSSR